jgi:hypothetical protein
VVCVEVIRDIKLLLVFGNDLVRLPLAYTLN